MTDAAETILRRCLEGTGTPALALMHLLLAGESVAAIEARLAALPAAGSPRAAALRATFAAARRRLDAAAAVAAGSGALHAARDVAAVARAFDTAVAVSPEASVALGSLGDPDRLADGTAEIVGWLDRQRLLAPDRDVLDLGCGIGRLAAALAPRVASVTALDVSPGMIAEARRRHGGLAGVTWRVTDGQSLDGVADGSVDLVLAVDVFPYLVQVGAALAARHLAEAARVLRAGGRVAILNWSYGGEAAADDAERRDLAAAADRAGLALLRTGERPFRHWDGMAFLLGRGG